MSENKLRWRLTDVDDGSGQGALFDGAELMEHHVGTGEFRGMEFLHVNARSIINEVPAASRVPFRYTINVYRGCSHACAYCLSGDTPVLMADGRTRAIADLRVGDAIYGTVREGVYLRFRPTTVLAHWSTVKPAYRVTLEDGTELVASADHRFLTGRGWKHVVGTGCGAGQRPHLTTNNELLGTGAFAPGPVENDEYRRGYLCGMIRGDGHVGHYVYPRGARKGAVHQFRLALIDLEPLRRARRYLDDANFATREFIFQRAVGSHQTMSAIRTSTAAGVAAIEGIIAWPDVPSLDWAKGFLAGIFDAEGSFGGILRISNADPVILRYVESMLRCLGFRCAPEPARANGVRNIRLVGGLVEHLRFFHTVDPAITRKRQIHGRAVKTDARLRVVAVEPMGIELPMYDITTGTGDFIANGVVSHNCFARPTHEYLGLDIGRDFERRIVVKVNAVELLQAELAGRRWSGHHIAMGTNTDPYQRCEGKYHLTQGVVQVLAEAANPFSILTKSTLILRDLDLLADAARRTDVRANFSIGTLDEEVWRLTEPGTPPPRKRVEAVRRLNQAGVPCGVLVAPIIPGLSDSPSQLEEVVTACVEAGAESLSAIALHLRPGVRDHFFDWLGGARPDLVPAFERRYRRAYLPASEQRELSERVARIAAKASGRPARRRSAPAPPQREAPAGQQLGLGI